MAKDFKIISLDPGTQKCGLAVLTSNGQIILRKIIPPAGLIPELKNLLSQYCPKLMVVGQGTGFKEIAQKIKDLGFPFEVTEEKFSSWQARSLYWQLNPARGLKKLIPRGLLLPPEPLDDLSAVIIGRNYLSTLL